MSHSKITFLDLLATFKMTHCTRLYTKPTDKHMYLDYHSEHPLSLKEINCILSYFENEETPL